LKLDQRKSQIRNPKSQIEPVQFKISDIGFEMQDSSNFTFFNPGFPKYVVTPEGEGFGRPRISSLESFRRSPVYVTLHCRRPTQRVMWRGEMILINRAAEQHDLIYPFIDLTSRL
jgi:hypothetical protein